MSRALRGHSEGVSAILVEVCRGVGGLPPLHSDAVPELVAAARFHRVAPLVHVAHRDVAPHVSELFREDRIRAITGHLQACAALHELGEVLADIDWVTFKGAVFSEFAHPVPGLRSYNDVDVLVSPASLREVSRRLLAAGWRVADYQDMLRNRAVPGEMHWVSPGGAFIDLHWSMINMASRRKLFSVPTHDLLQRRVQVTLGADPAWTLDPVDLLLHACLHAALAGANKLLYLVDVDWLSRRITDWDEVAARARAWRAQAQVALVLGRAERVLGTQLPPEFVRALQVPRSLQLLMAATDRVAPVPRGRRSVGLNKFVARAVRPDALATAAALGRNAALWLGERVPGESSPTRARLRADQASLDVYLESVEAAAAPPAGSGQQARRHV